MALAKAEAEAKANAEAKARSERELQEARRATQLANDALKMNGTELQQKLAGRLDAMEAERAAHMAKLQASAKKIDDLQEQLDRAKEAEIAADEKYEEMKRTMGMTMQDMQSEMKQKMGAKMYKMFGPGSLLLETFAAWARSCDMASNNKDMDELRKQIAASQAAETAAFRSGNETAMAAARDAQVKARAKMSEKLWKQNGPQNTVRSFFIEWKMLNQMCKHDNVLKSALGAAGDREAKMKKQIGEKLWKQYGPQNALQTVLASWQQACEMSKVETMVGRLNHVWSD
jgi:hypothetical protein